MLHKVQQIQKYWKHKHCYGAALFLVGSNSGLFKSLWVQLRFKAKKFFFISFKNFIKSFKKSKLKYTKNRLCFYAKFQSNLGLICDLIFGLVKVCSNNDQIVLGQCTSGKYFFHAWCSLIFWCMVPVYLYVHCTVQ